MTAVPLGRGAWTRLYSGGPVIELLNRWVEANPANPREGVAILARPGTTNLLGLDPGGFSGLGPIRGLYALNGLFDDDLFVVCGDALYRIDNNLNVTPITGVINGLGHPEVAWQKGIGYERLWIADGTLLQYYSGNTSASGTLTLTGSIVNGTDKFEVGGTYYVWGTSFNVADAGTSAHPFVVNPLADPLGQLVKAFNNTGVPGTDYSSTIAGENVNVSASKTSATVVKFTAKAAGSGGNTITFTVVGGTALTASGFSGGGINALSGATVPDGKTVISVGQVSGYILVATTDSQVFYWINPGATEINPLDFASKESSPDNITQIKVVGDQALIIGSKSTESWYATGDPNTPFRRVEGRVYARGAIEGTCVVVDDGVILVGDDGRVYTIGLSSGGTSGAGYGVERISNNSIEERIRRMIRREKGLTP